jgi:hypothetical protein
MEAEMFPVWSVRWLYNEYKASSSDREARESRERGKRVDKESREWEYNGTQQFQISVNNGGRRIQEVSL